jgi:hypothetical protein
MRMFLMELEVGTTELMVLVASHLDMGYSVIRIRWTFGFYHI